MSSPGISVVICVYTEDRWEDILAADALVLIEWPERAAELLPSDHVGIELQHVPNDEAHRLLLAG